MTLLAQCLLLAWLLAGLLPQRWRLLAIAPALLALIPLGNGISAAMALRGMWGDPSATTLQLVLLSLLGRTPASIAKDWKIPAGVAACAALFYPLALGLGDFDPYRFGFQPLGLVVVLASLAMLAWWRGQSLLLWLFAVDLIVFAAGWHESRNLWDVLIDPLLAIAMLVLALRNGLAAWKARQEEGAQ